MTCPKCQSPNVATQVLQDVTIKTQHKGALYWLFIGWWWLPLKWLFFTLPALIIKIFSHKKQKVVTKEKTVCICQNCGFRWDLQ